MERLKRKKAALMRYREVKAGNKENLSVMEAAKEVAEYRREQTEKEAASFDAFDPQLAVDEYLARKKLH